MTVLVQPVHETPREPRNARVALAIQSYGDCWQRLFEELAEGVEVRGFDEDILKFLIEWLDQRIELHTAVKQALESHCRFSELGRKLLEETPCSALFRC